MGSLGICITPGYLVYRYPAILEAVPIRGVPI